MQDRPSLNAVASGLTANTKRCCSPSHAAVPQRWVDIAISAQIPEISFEIVRALTPYCPRPLLPKLLRVALSIRDPELERQSAILILEQVKLLPRHELYEMWSEVKKNFDKLNRSDLASDICALLPLIESIGERDAMNVAFDAVLKAPDWWP